MRKSTTILLLLLAVLCACNPTKKKNSYEPVSKMSTNDPYQSTMTESQFFEIDANNDNVIEGEQGIIITIPKGALLSKGDKIVTGNVKVELTEALNLSDMIFSNLTTVSNGELLSTGGMFYISFTQNGEQLAINKKIPVYVQIPKNTDKQMLLYKGTRDSLGNMNWTDPQKPVKYLTLVPLASLNFTPIIFDETLAENLPFSGVSVPTRKFTDSLYYSIDHMFLWMSLYTPLYNSKEMLEPNGKRIEYYLPDSNITEETDVSARMCRINPRSVAALKDSKFENTFISTREFEARVQAIHKTCNQSVLDVYVNNIDKDLSVVDAMAADLLKGTEDEIVFRNFANEGLTNVKDAANEKYAKILSDFYRNRTEKLDKQTENIQNKVKESLEKKDKEYVKHLNEYQEILRKREKHRMEYFGYQLTDQGWLNVDTGTVPKTWFEKKIDMTVTNTDKFDMLNVYVWMPNNTSLMRLIPQGNNLFMSQSERGTTIPLEKDKQFQIFAIGKIGDRYFLSESKYTPTMDDVIKDNLTLSESTKEAIDNILNQQSKYSSKVNSIAVDQKYQQYFYEKQKAYDYYVDERQKVMRLYYSVCSCGESVEVPSTTTSTDTFAVDSPTTWRIE